MKADRVPVPLEDRPFCLTCGAIISDEMHQEYLEVAEFTQDQLNVMNNIACILSKLWLQRPPVGLTFLDWSLYFSQVAAYLSRPTETLEVPRIEPRTYLDVCKVCLKKQSGIFHKQDMLRARVVDLAFESSIEMGQFPLAREYGEELVSSYRKYYGPTHPLLGLLHLKLAKLLLYLEESQEAVTHAWLAQKVLKVTHGEDHSLYQGELAAVIQQCHSHKLFQPNP
uniref:Uncharacterized protein n=1 Tax=Timema monikensis TaxID=170555 RepID=A0A7R9EC92_9NEOP|nr:unnamed protein product [Timema monikensis]